MIFEPLLFFFLFLGLTEECPKGMVSLPPNKDGGKCIDKYEQAVEYLENGVWKLHPFNYPLDGLESGSYRAVDSSGIILPQAYISQQQSKNSCLNSEKRLCKYFEWMAGCQGGEKNNYTYPYGNTFKKFACNTGNANPVIRLFGPHPSWSYKEMNDPRLDTLNNTLVKGGTFEECCSKVVGSCDQAGNLDEWIDMTTSEGHAVFKGGYFVDDIINGPGCLYLTRAHGPDYHDYSLGFRCCI